METTRAILAGLFVFCGLTIAVALLAPLLEVFPPLLGIVLFSLLISIAFIAVSLIALIIFNLPWSFWTQDIGKNRFLSLEEEIANLEQQGLLETVGFRATRAFKVGESEDEGPHYFLELENGNVLYMNGQYLYEYEQEDEEDIDIEGATMGRFPCTNFTVRRHRDKGYVVELVCRGELLPVEYVEVAVKKMDYFWNLLPDGGGILTEASFDALRDSLR